MTVKFVSPTLNNYPNFVGIPNLYQYAESNPQPIESSLVSWNPTTTVGAQEKVLKTTVQTKIKQLPCQGAKGSPYECEFDANTKLFVRLCEEEYCTKERVSKVYIYQSNIYAELTSDSTDKKLQIHQLFVERTNGEQADISPHALTVSSVPGRLIISLPVGAPMGYAGATFKLRFIAKFEETSQRILNIGTFSKTIPKVTYKVTDNIEVKDSSEINKENEKESLHLYHFKNVDTLMGYYYYFYTILRFLYSSVAFLFVSFLGLTGYAIKEVIQNRKKKI